MKVTVFIASLIVAGRTYAADCASPLLDAHIDGIRTFVGGYSPGFSPGPGVTVANFAGWTKALSSAAAQALEKDNFSVVKNATLDTTKAGHLHDYMIEAGNTSIPWWVTLPANAIPSGWVGAALDVLTATLDGTGADARQTLTEAAGTVAVGGRVQMLERVVTNDQGLTFVSVTVYQVKVAAEYRTTVLQWCTAPVRVEN